MFARCHLQLDGLTDFMYDVFIRRQSCTQIELQFVRIKTKKRELMMGVGAFHARLPHDDDDMTCQDAIAIALSHTAQTQS